MKKPYKLVCNSKAKKPYVLGTYATEKQALTAMAVFKKRQVKSLEAAKNCETSFIDLKILGPEI
jgi:hypothetical protein